MHFITTLATFLGVAVAVPTTSPNPEPFFALVVR